MNDILNKMNNVRLTEGNMSHIHFSPASSNVDLGTLLSTALNTHLSDLTGREQNPLAVDAAVKALISEHATDTDSVIYTDGSVVRHQKSAWAFTALTAGRIVYEASCAFADNKQFDEGGVRSNKGISLAACRSATQHCILDCILSDSLSMIRKIESGTARRQWLEILADSTIRKTTFIFVPGHAGVQENERADRLASSSAITEGRPMYKSEVNNKNWPFGGL